MTPPTCAALLAELLGHADRARGDVIARLPTEDEFRALEAAVTASDLFDPAAPPVPYLGDLCAVVAETLARGIHERLGYGPTLEPDEAGTVLAAAAAVGWRSPVGRVCTRAEFDALLRHYGVPAGPDADRPVVRSGARTLRDVLSGFDAPGTDSPFVDVYCLRGAFPPAGGPKADPDADADDGGGLPLPPIRELLVVGRGVGENRRWLQEALFAVGMSLHGSALVADGLIHLTRDAGGRIEAVLGESGQTPGFLQGHDEFAPDALGFAYRELRELANTSRFVRLHEVAEGVQKRLVLDRLAKLRAAPEREAALMAPELSGDEVAAACFPAPVRGGRGAVRVRLPLAVVRSDFFEQKIGVFERVMLQRVREGVRRRERFHDNEVVADRDKLGDFADKLARFVGLLGPNWKPPPVDGADPDDEAPAPGGPDLARVLRRAVREITAGDAVREGDVRAFTSVCGLITQQIDAVLADRGAGDEVRALARTIKDRLDEPRYLNTLVNHDRGTKRAMAQPRKTDGREFLGQILPESIRLHLRWRGRMRRLRERIEAAARSPGLRQWTAGVVLDLVLRDRDLDFGGQTREAFAEFKRAARPLLLLAYARALKKFGVVSPDALKAANLVFACTFRADPARPDELLDLVLVPHYFYDARYAALTLPARSKLARLDDLTTEVEAVAPPPVRDRARITADVAAVIAKNGGPDAAAEQLLADFRADPRHALGALLDARRPGEHDVDLSAVNLDGLFTLLRTQRLVAAHAAPAALVLLADAVRAGCAALRGGAGPYGLSQPLNRLPDIPWHCLELLAVSLAQGGEPLPPELRTTLDVIRRWVQLMPGGRHQPNPRHLPEAPGVNQLVVDCITLAEAWQPGFLGAMFAPAEKKVLHSARLGSLLTAVAGGDLDPTAFAPEGWVAHHQHLTQEQARAQWEAQWAAHYPDLTPENVRVEYKRRRAEEARQLLPALARIGRAARAVTEEGLDGVELYDRVKFDLARLYLLMGETHSLQTHELLDDVLRAQHAFQKTRDG